jgi:hypothetical protein
VRNPNFEDVKEQEAWSQRILQALEGEVNYFPNLQ